MTQSAMRPPTEGAPGTTGTSPLRTDQLAELRAMLEQQRRFRLDQLGELQAPNPSTTTSPGEREVTDSLVVGARAALRDVVDALRRMDDGRYGSCRRCGTALEVARLEVLPQVSLCMPCQRVEQDS